MLRVIKAISEFQGFLAANMGQPIALSTIAAFERMVVGIVQAFMSPEE